MSIVTLIETSSQQVRNPRLCARVLITGATLTIKPYNVFDACFNHFATLLITLPHCVWGETALFDAAPWSDWRVSVDVIYRAYDDRVVVYALHDCHMVSQKAHASEMRFASRVESTSQVCPECIADCITPARPWWMARR
jgi:hypothetical protein